jgi:S1-C subfamily serine protease
VLVGVLLTVLVGGLGLLFGMGMGRGQAPVTAPATPAPVAAPAVTAEPVVQTAEPTTEPEPASLANDELAEAYGDSVLKVVATGCGTESSGTAWVLDDHHLVTNWHVVSTDPTPELVSRDGRETYSGSVIGGTTEPDVAVIRVEEALPDPMDWAETDDLREGQEVVSLGYPAPEGDFAVTPSTILSFQMEGSSREAIRGDGALDRGNSGGPALTRDGEVAGVATLMVQEANQLQMLPILFTADALRPTVDRMIADPEMVEADCAPEFATLPDDWAPDYDDWASGGPQSYGDDDTLDGLYDSCAAGDLGACDDLWWSSAYGSDYEAFATTCGGTSDPSFGTCESSAEWAQQEAQWEAEQEAEEQRQIEEEQRQAQEAAALLAGLVSGCQAGDMQACDDLEWEADYSSSEYEVAVTCGGYFPDGWGSCVDRQAEAAELQVLVDACLAGDMQACDDLYWSATSGTPEQAVADDCGGLYPGDGGMCVYRQENP